MGFALAVPGVTTGDTRRVDVGFALVLDARAMEDAGDEHDVSDGAVVLSVRDDRHGDVLRYEYAHGNVVAIRQVHPCAVGAHHQVLQDLSLEGHGLAIPLVGVLDEVVSREDRRLLGVRECRANAQDGECE